MGLLAKLAKPGTPLPPDRAGVLMNNNNEIEIINRIVVTDDAE